MTTIKGKECKFVVHVPSNHPDVDDVHLIKEVTHFTDGTTQPSIRLVRNYKRPYWITKRAFRNHKQKKECEHISKLDRFDCTESNLRNQIARSLDKGWSKDHLKELLASPYVYGADVSSMSFIKNEYKQKYSDCVSPNSLAFLDIETDMVHGHKKTVLITVVAKGICFTAVTEEFISGIADVQGLYELAKKKYINEYIEKHKLETKLVVVKNNIEAFKAAFSLLHQIKPDIVAIWNINYDIPKIIGEIEDEGLDPTDIFSDPSVPKMHRLCKYKLGKTKRVTASGKVMPINIAAQWHTLHLTASFYVIDAMCVYKLLRLAKQEQPHYSLDWILNLELGIRKLKFKEADGYEKEKWHSFMQTFYKIEYAIYNMFDCISMIELDAKTTDLAYAFTSSCDTTEFTRFNSQPKKIADAFFYFTMKNKDYVLGTVGYANDNIKSEDMDEDIVLDEAVDEVSEDDMVYDEGERCLSLAGWIVTLPSYMSVLGLRLIEEDHTLQTNIRAFVYDSDSSAAYPSATSVCNVSKATTFREIIDINGIDEYKFRLQNLNMVLGATNSLEYCVNMFNMPEPYELLTLIE
jgi:hypothetical protein